LLSSSGEPAPGDSFQHIAKAKATASEVGLKVAAGGAQALKEAVWGEEMLGAEAAEVHALRVVLVGERGFIGGEYLTETGSMAEVSTRRCAGYFSATTRQSRRAGLTTMAGLSHTLALRGEQLADEGVIGHVFADAPLHVFQVGHRGHLNLTTIGS
jgi:hypothetical protein